MKDKDYEKLFVKLFTAVIKACEILNVAQTEIIDEYMKKDNEAPPDF